MAHAASKGTLFHEMLSLLISRMSDRAFSDTGVIPWSSPVPSFGDIERAELATLGLNPSNREFVDEAGDELVGPDRRFETLRSLQIDRWADARPRHLDAIAKSCQRYFTSNPYDGWFKRLDGIVRGAGVTFYGEQGRACHLDLVPYATSRKWTGLTGHEKRNLFQSSADTLGLLLRASRIKVLVLNGSTVVANFEKMSGQALAQREMARWSLPRASSAHVRGVAYSGKVRRFGAIDLGRDIRVLGFNHNIQSSFGVTRSVIGAISSWVAQNASEELA